MYIKFVQKLAVLCLILGICLFTSACAGVEEMAEIIPPLPTYSDETPQPAPAVITPSPTVEVSPAHVASDMPVSFSPAPALVTAAPTPSPVPSEVPDVPVISIIGETLPEDMVACNVSTLHGKITTDRGSIVMVRAFLIDSQGTAVQECYFQPMQAHFSLAGTVNAQLRFAELIPGGYVYRLLAVVEYEGRQYEEELIYHPFVVYASYDEMRGVSEQLSPEFTAKITHDTSNAGRIWNFLVVYLDNPYGAAGVLANIELESGCNPQRVQGDFSEGFIYSQSYTELVDSGNVNKESFIAALPAEGYGSGYGLCQWSFDRKEGLYDLAKANGTSIGDLETQCAYLISELEVKYPKLATYLKECTDARQAAREFCYVFEQAGEMGDRAGIAEDFLERFAKNTD